LKIIVNVKPNSKTQKVEKKGNEFIVWLKSPPVDGKANKELIEVLAKYFDVKKRDIEIKSGATSRKKLIIIKE